MRSTPGALVPNGQIHRPMKLDTRLLRPEPDIRRDLEQQLTDILAKWELWKCQ
jgi:hypothetical protein